MKQHQIVEVSASSGQGAIMGAIINSAAAKPAQNPISQVKWFQVSFAFIIVFASVIYFREEIYAYSKDVSKHPILAGVENQQLHTYLGSKWIFGSGPKEDVEKAEKAMNSTKSSPSESDSSKGQLVQGSSLTAITGSNKPTDSPEIKAALAEAKAKLESQRVAKDPVKVEGKNPTAPSLS